MKITINGTEELAKFVSQLVREGVMFNARPIQNDVGVVQYEVELTGGF